MDKRKKDKRGGQNSKKVVVQVAAAQDEDINRIIALGGWLAGSKI